MAYDRNRVKKVASENSLETVLPEIVGTLAPKMDKSISGRFCV